MATSKLPASARRAPLPRQQPRATKAPSSTGAATQPLAHVRTIGVELDVEDRAYIRRKLGMKLGKFGADIERISVRVEDVNGPRGGVDQRCRIKVVLRGLPSVLVESVQDSAQVAIDDSINAARQAVQSALQRRRTKAIDRKAATPVARIRAAAALKRGRARSAT
jgi:hypothetical protein